MGSKTPSSGSLEILRSETKTRSTNCRSVRPLVLWVHLQTLGWARCVRPRHAAEMTTLRLIGYWGKGRWASWPDPHNFVDTDWDPVERAAVLNYLRGGRQFALGGALQAGFSTCRICDEIDGTKEFTDGAYVWPEGLTHYVAVHDVRLPEEFVAHVLAQDDAVPLSPSEFAVLEHEAGIDRGWWKQIRSLDVQ